MDDSEPFAVTYALSLDDQVRGSRILFNRRWSIRLFYACLGLFWILAVGLALLLLFNGETGRLEGLIPGLVMPLVLMGLVYGLGRAA